jgi:hypothetical protein
MSDTMASGCMDDTLIISGSSDATIDLGNYGAAQSTFTIGNIDTITLDSSSYITSGNTINWNSNYNYGDYGNITNSNARVNIDADGIKIKEDGDLRIGDRSLRDFMDRVEDRLAILHPNEILEDKWEQLKDLRRQYEALEKDILEKEKIMKILKEQ